MEAPAGRGKKNMGIATNKRVQNLKSQANFTVLLHFVFLRVKYVKLLLYHRNFAESHTDI